MDSLPNGDKGKNGIILPMNSFSEIDVLFVSCLLVPLFVGITCRKLFHYLGAILIGTRENCRAAKEGRKTAEISHYLMMLQLLINLSCGEGEGLSTHHSELFTRL